MDCKQKEKRKKMKQYITKKQFEELTPEQAEVFYGWQLENNWALGGTPDRTPDIVQMLEFIDSKEWSCWGINIDKNKEWSINSNNLYGKRLGTRNYTVLCDLLWDCVKYCLDKSRYPDGDF